MCCGLNFNGHNGLLRLTYVLLLIVIVGVIMGLMVMPRERFTVDTPTIEKIKSHITNSPNMDYSGSYLKFLMDNSISEPQYLEQSFYYGCMTLKKLDLLTIENMKKLF